MLGDLAVDDTEDVDGDHGLGPQPGDSDEAGRLYRFEAGQRSEAKPDTVPT
jgi:hypothetical protein